MNPPEPQHDGRSPSGPPLTYPMPGREPMRGGAVAGGILSVSSAALAFLITFADWASTPPSFLVSPLEQNLWELGDRLEFFPFGFLGVVTVANMVLSVIFLAMSTNRKRQGTAIILVVTGFIQFIVLVLTVFAAAENDLSSDGLPWVLSFLCFVVLIAGSITALVGSRSKAVETVALPPAQAVPPVPQDPPRARTEQSLKSSIEELAELRDKGFLSEEEFERKRREALGLD